MQRVAYCTLYMHLSGVIMHPFSLGARAVWEEVVIDVEVLEVERVIEVLEEVTEELPWHHNWLESMVVSSLLKVKTIWVLSLSLSLFFQV